jgi:hypothetical protein
LFIGQAGPYGATHCTVIHNLIPIARRTISPSEACPSGAPPSDGISTTKGMVLRNLLSDKDDPNILRCLSIVQSLIDFISCRCHSPTHARQRKT